MMVFQNSLFWRGIMYTAIPYWASTGPEQGFPREVFLTWRNLFSLQGTPLLIAGTLFSLQEFPCEKNFSKKTLFSLKPCFHYRELVCSVHNTCFSFLLISPVFNFLLLIITRIFYTVSIIGRLYQTKSVGNLEL